MESSTSQAVKVRAQQDHKSRVLDFLSTASKETLVGCLVGLGAITNVVLGRLGLLLIGIVCGILLHATWDGSSQDTTSGGVTGAELKRRKELGLEIILRTLDWQEKRPHGLTSDCSEDHGTEVTLSAGRQLDFTDFKPATDAALTGLVDAVIRDYVKWWYGPILPLDESFPSACRQTLTSFLLAVSCHLSRKRPADTFLNFLTNATSIFIVFLSELSNALMTGGMSELDPSEAIVLYLNEGPSNLANLLDKKEQEKKFKAVAGDILETFLDSKAYNCEPVRVFLREILAGLILEMTLKSCSKAEWINGWIVYLLEDGEPEIMNAIDAGMGGAAGIETKHISTQPIANKRSSNQLTVMPSDPSMRKSSPHQRNINKAEDAMEEAMLEAKRLTELMALEDAEKSKSAQGSILPTGSDTAKITRNLVPGSNHGTAHTQGLNKISDYPTYSEERTSNDDNNSSGRGTEHESTPTSSESDLTRSYDHLSSLDENGAASPSKSTVPTTFDEILPPTTHNGHSRSQAVPPMTLHNASVTIFDDAMPGEKASNVIRAKPTIDYLLQVEPSSSQYPGWMMARKYADFETLHEIIGTISKISGVTSFTQKYSSFPTWKNQSKDQLRDAMEAYLRDALSHVTLAESEGMKRFLEKDQTLDRLGSSGKGVLGFPTPHDFENMGKGMLDVLVSAPKGVAGGGKALLEGVSGVFGQKKPPLPARPSNANRAVSGANHRRNTVGDDHLRTPVSSSGRTSQDSPRASFDIEKQRERNWASSASLADHAPQAVNGANPTSPNSLVESSAFAPREMSPRNSISTTSLKSTAKDPVEDLVIHLPPPPSEITDDYRSEIGSPRASISVTDRSILHSSVKSPSSSHSPHAANRPVHYTAAEQPPPLKPTKPKQAAPPLTEQETQVAVELFFAMINELYTLSSAWQIRRTILNAAKTFLLRPGNPNLEAIRVLLQDTVIEANTSDAGLATLILKLRENSLPTEEELAAWPPPLSEVEQEKLRKKARKLLVERGMPQALTSVMGAAASGEALGRIFDSLQVEDVARGLMFAMMLQGIRALTH